MNYNAEKVRTAQSSIETPILHHPGDRGIHRPRNPPRPTNSRSPGWCKIGVSIFLSFFKKLWFRLQLQNLWFRLQLQNLWFRLQL